MKSIFGLFGVVLTLILNTVYGQDVVNQVVDGPCSRFQVSDQQPFFKKLFMGTWYVYASYDYKDTVELDCLKAFYQLTPAGNALNTESGKNLATNQRKTFHNDFYFDKPGVGFYTFEEESIDIPVADYMHYYIEFSCVDLPKAMADCYIGVYTRLPFPGPIIVNRINEFINAHNIDRTKLRFINHDIIRCAL